MAKLHLASGVGPSFPLCQRTFSACSLAPLEGESVLWPSATSQPDFSLSGSRVGVRVMRRNASLPGMTVSAWKDRQSSAGKQRRSRLLALGTKPRATGYRGKGVLREEMKIGGLEISLKKIYLNIRKNSIPRPNKKRRETQPAFPTDTNDADFPRFMPLHDSQRRCKAKDSLSLNLEHMVREQAHKRTPFKQMRLKSPRRLRNMMVLVRNSEARRAAAKTMEWKPETNFSITASGDKP